MLLYYFVAALLAGAGYYAHRRWHRGIEADLAEGAKEAYRRVEARDPALLEGLDETRFRDIYVRTYEPRFPAYALSAAGVFLFGVPIVLGLLSGFAILAAQWGWIPQPGDMATDLYLNSGNASVIRRVSPETLSYILQGWSGFYYFFGVLGFWIAVVLFFMRRYHRRSPGSLREEVLRSR